MPQNPAGPRLRGPKLHEAKVKVSQTPPDKIAFNLCSGEFKTPLDPFALRSFGPLDPSTFALRSFGVMQPFHCKLTDFKGKKNILKLDILRF